VIAFGVFLILGGAVSWMAYGGDVEEDGAFGRHARFQVAIARVALIVGVPVFLLGLAMATLS